MAAGGLGLGQQAEGSGSRQGLERCCQAVPLSQALPTTFSLLWRTRYVKGLTTCISNICAGNVRV